MHNLFRFATFKNEIILIPCLQNQVRDYLFCLFIFDTFQLGNLLEMLFCNIWKVLQIEEGLPVLQRSDWTIFSSLTNGFEILVKFQNLC